MDGGLNNHLPTAFFSFGFTVIFSFVAFFFSYSLQLTSEKKSDVP